nr:FkbM family methyltransferase [Methylomarinum sp. Ch1-1]MDP4521195.1 FkbM family methyltransferase [Methylomarinum sp. Ch1-1]
MSNGIGYENVFMTEMWMVEVLKRVSTLNSGSFLDIGANIGQSLLKLRAVSKTTPWLGLEPNPACSAYLSNLIRINNFEKSLLIPIGLYNSCDLLQLDFFAEGNAVDSGASLVKNPAFRPSRPVIFSQTVPVFTYSDIQKFSPEAPGIIKIDVEGGEYEVLESLVDLLQSEHPIILIEILPMSSEEDTFAKNIRLETYFNDMNYLLYRIEKNQERFSHLVLLEAIGTNKEPTGWDYLAVPLVMQETVEKNFPC